MEELSAVKKLHQKENQKFIAWSINKLRTDDTFYREVTGKITRELGRFYRENGKDVILEALKEKMQAGAKEHGSICRDFEKLAKEVNAERLDILGWEMMRLYQLDKESYSDRYKA